MSLLHVGLDHPLVVLLYVIPAIILVVVLVRQRHEGED